MNSEGLADALKEAKARNKWSYRFIAERVGTVQTTVFHWARGTRPEPEFWPAIADLLSVPLSEIERLVGYGGNGGEMPPVTSFEEGELLRWYRLASDEAKRMIRAVARSAFENRNGADESLGEGEPPRRAARQRG